MAEFVGCPAPYRESVERRLVERGLLPDPEASAGPDPAADGLEGNDDERKLVIVLCDSPDRWDLITSAAEDPSTVVIAVLSSLILDDYTRALAAGAAGVVYFDTPSSMTADVIVAAVGGEVILPRQAAQNMALLAKRLKPPTDLDETEVVLLKGVAAGRTLGELANELFFSERTVRRHLQSLYLKIGVKNRAGAIAAASRMGLAD